MTHTVELEVELPVTGTDSVEYRCIDIECDYYIENNGIGHYEFWGDKGFDRGFDYAVIENTKWNSDGFTKEEIELINLQINKNILWMEERVMEAHNEPYVDFSYPDDD